MKRKLQYEILSSLEVNVNEADEANNLIKAGYIDGYIIQSFNGKFNEIFAMRLNGLTDKGKKRLAELKHSLIVRPV